MEGGRPVALLFLGDAAPRAWSAEDLALAREAAERTRTAEERLRTEAALRESEDRLRRAIAAAGNIATCDLDLPGDRMRGDAAFAMFFGLEEARAAAGVTRAEAMAAIHEEDRPRVERSSRGCCPGPGCAPPDLRPGVNRSPPRGQHRGLGRASSPSSSTACGAVTGGCAGSRAARGSRTMRRGGRPGSRPSSWT
jgi:hypothetical protein